MLNRTRINLILLICVFCLPGCSQIVKRQVQKHEVAREVLNTSEEEELIDAVTALESVSEAITGRELTQEELRQLSNDLRKDEAAQSAIKSISTALDPNKVRVKYSPATGKRYNADMEYCPETGVKLLPVE